MRQGAPRYSRGMASPRTVVIVGTGIAGAAAVSELRERGHEGEIVLLGPEEHLPYDRPPLSKDVLLGEKEAAETALHDEGWYAERDVDVRLGTPATGLDTVARVVRTPDGEIGYDALLLATGSEPRRLPEAERVGPVSYLRSLDDSKALRAALLERPRLVIVGAGWIGLEVAAAARSLECEVTVVEPQDQPLIGVVGERVGSVFADLHRSHDVDLRLATPYDGEPPVPADLVVVAIGAAPRLDLAREAGLAVDSGVLVDATLRTTDPHVWAAGDIADHDHPALGRLRVEHWDNAIEQGRTAARNMLGAEEAYERTPYFFSDQYDLGLEYVGHVPREHLDSFVVRGDLDGREAVVLWHDAGRVLGGLHLNVWDATDHLKALVGRTVDPQRLADPTVELAELAG